MKSGSTSSDDVRVRAEAKFQQAERRKSDADKTMREVKAAKDAESAKTSRLRTLRLAKEEADRQAAALVVKPVAAPRRRKAQPAASQS